MKNVNVNKMCICHSYHKDIILSPHLKIHTDKQQHFTTVLFITVVSTVVFMVTFEGQGNAGT